MYKIRQNSTFTQLNTKAFPQNNLIDRGLRPVFGLSF